MGTINAYDNKKIIEYTITDGNIRNAFAINSDGLLTIASNVNHESTNRYSLTVQVTDRAGNTASNTVIINVISIALPTTDTNAPNIHGQSFNVVENVPIGTFVGVVNANDNERITNYAIIAGNTDNAFVISWSGILTTANNIDYETTNTYNLTVQVTDGAGNTASNIITVNVIDVALPPSITISGVSVIELTNAILEGELTDLGDSSDNRVQVSEHGFIYSTTAYTENSLLLDAHGVEYINLGARNTTGQFSNRLIDLEECTTYYYRAFAVNDIGTNFSKVRSFSPIKQHATFSLSGATDGEQSGLICPGGTRTYSVPLSNTHSYNLAINIASNILDNFVIYEGTSSSELYIQAGPFSITTLAILFGHTNFTTTFSGTNTGRRYLVLPPTTTNYRLVLSNSNAGTESYTLTLGEERGTASQPVGRLLIDETPMGFFNSNDPELYWMYLPPNISSLQTRVRGVSGASCGATVDTVVYSVGSVSSNFNNYNNLANNPSNRYVTLWIFNAGSYDYTKCQFSFRGQ